jgi:hypothetical protein
MTHQIQSDAYALFYSVRLPIIIQELLLINNFYVTAKMSSTSNDRPSM